jgi:outer membrane immunogenic protein
MKTFKLALAGTALVGALATSAMAGECSFSGFYLGAQLGAGTTNVEGKDSPTATKLKLAATGLIGGLHAGYGKHFPNRFYVGLEAYGNLSSNNQTHTAAGIRIKTQRNNSFGLALRPGVVFGNALFYAKAGVESANFKLSDKSSRRTGFVPGLGVAFHATDHVIVGVEATHTFYNSRKVGTTKMQPQATDFFARLSYKW